MTNVRRYLSLIRKYGKQMMYYQLNVPLNLIYDFIDTLDRDDTLSRLKKFKRWDVSKRLIGGTSFQQMIMDREFKPGTFGAEFKEWSNKSTNNAVDLFKISIDVKQRSKKPSELFEAFQRHSMLQHDLIHFFNGYDTSTIGEISVLSYHLANEWKKSWAFIIMIGFFVSIRYTLFGKGWPVVNYWRWVKEAYRRGKDSVDFIFVDWESMFNKPLEDVKKEIGITGSPEYWEKTKVIRRAWVYEAKKAAV